MAKSLLRSQASHMQLGNSLIVGEPGSPLPEKRKESETDIGTTYKHPKSTRIMMNSISSQAATTKANLGIRAPDTDAAGPEPDRADRSTGQVGRRTRSKKDRAPRTCDICEEELDAAKDFPKTCTHDTFTCATCLANTLSASLSNVYISQIVCAQCARPWKVSQLALFASDTDIHEYIKRYGEADPDFRRCLGPDCEHGQIYERALQHPRFKCKRCAFQMCFRHKTPWHKGQTCKQYDDLLADESSEPDQAKLRQRVAREEQKTDKKAKPCPKCGEFLHCPQSK